MSNSSLPDWTGLTGDSESDGRVYGYNPPGTEELCCRKRLYSPGVYLSKLDSSLLGGRLFDVNVLGWEGFVRA